jgi:hypothetical protein
MAQVAIPVQLLPFTIFHFATHKGATMDSLLKGLFGDQDDDNAQRNKAQDFISRYEQGSPYDNIADDEVLNNYQSVAGRLSPQEFEDSAAEAYERLSPEERRQFAQYLQEQGGQDFAQTDDPRQLARYTSQMQSQQPDGLAGLLGGGGLGGMLGGGGGGGIGGMLSGALGGQSQGGGQGGMMQNPMAKAVMGGIAAMAMKRMMGGR